MQHTFIRQLFALAVSLILAGCQGFNPVTDTAGHFLSNKSSNASFSAGFEYLEVEWQGLKASMALGYRETKGNNVTEHWYSGQGEMVKIVNGRVVQVLGMTKEVRHVGTNTPVWSDILAHRLPIVWSQTKEVMPGYRYGLKEYVITQQVNPIAAEKTLITDATAWVLEEIKSKDEKGKAWIYQQKFALNGDKVIYSEQCLAPRMCFKLRPLGVVVSK